MKYFLIAGEASGDLHAANLMKAIHQEDPEAEFQFYGGDLMAAVGGRLLCHYKNLAYMGFIPVLLHFPTILRGMAECKRQIEEWRPNVVILVDYPGFNLKIARFVHDKRICPVYYYISPKIWAWKEHRIQNIRRDIDRLFSILPFEIDFFEKKHHYPITYVGNPTVDEVAEYTLRNGLPQQDNKTIALLPGSRMQEVKDNLSRMLLAAAPFTKKRYRLVIAIAPALPQGFYEDILKQSGIPREQVELAAGKTYEILSHATAALVTSGTATLETALFRVPQVVCYYIACGKLVSFLRRCFLKVPYISLVNLVCGKEVVPELVADDMQVTNIRQHLEAILPDGKDRNAMLKGYEEMAQRLGEPGAPIHAAKEMVQALQNNHNN
ncbi:lipid-A-disaccharide synthase [gut metagenome]|uniref:lipid-A-disaccharide synthase n=1 Tax=gut metagenome TaxID=749906 RepID=J9CXZ0_9ZZZZ